MSGFSAVLGNPPFLGGSKISGNYGHSFRNFLINSICNGKPGKIDLCAYFWLNSCRLLSDNGFVGMVLTNTISQGENSILAIKNIQDKGFQINNALKNIPWQGDAAVVVSLISITNIETKEVFLNGLNVSRIDHHLNEALSVSWLPLPLKDNLEIAFSGTYMHGSGFFISNEQRNSLVEKNPNSANIIRKHLGGKDLNTQPNIEGSRWVLDFGEMDLNQAKKFPNAFEIIEKQVQPHRQSINSVGRYKLPEPMPTLFWQYWRTKSKYNSRIRGKFQSVIAIAQVSKTAQVAFVNPEQVLDAKLIVFSSDSYHLFGILTSNIHLVWCFSRCTTMKNDFTYTPSTLFETYPFSSESQTITEIAKELDYFRKEIMMDLNIGLTKLYNLFHDSNNDETQIKRLRELHCRLDYIVLKSYGWDDIDLEHGFNDSGQGIRFFPSKKAAREVLTRLVVLNKERSQI